MEAACTGEARTGLYNLTCNMRRLDPSHDSG